MNITPQEAQAILTLINRTDLKGSEAESVVIIKQKLMTIAKEVKEVKEEKEEKEEKESKK